MAWIFAWLVTVTAGLAVAQRPSGASTCDYYAEQMFGSNSSDTQFKLIQNIVALAFGGGQGLTNASAVTGIWNAGTISGTKINLADYFDGTTQTTNLNNQPIGINWMDDGAEKPLQKFLSGGTTNLTLSPTSNQYRLFQHFFIAFSRSFGCTLPYDPPNSTAQAQLGLAYIHKYMDLDYDQLAYFIDQFSQASRVYGFSEQDATTFSTSLNARFNVRCAPAVNGQYLSLCQNATCPLAAPAPDCNAYEDLQPNAQAVIANNSNPTTSASSSAATDPTPTSSSTSHHDHDSSLSAGAIAGIVIGSVVALLLGLAVLLLLLKRRRDHKRDAPSSQPPQFYGTGSYVPSSYGGPPSDAGGGFSPQMRHQDSWQDGGYKAPQSPPLGGTGQGHRPAEMDLHVPASPPPVEMESPRFEMGSDGRR